MSLVQTLVPRRSLTRDLALVAGGAALTALGAQVTIPWQPVPFTLQTLAVMLVGLGLGSRLAFFSELAYVGAGICGAPIFAGFTGGPQHLLGPTGGYLASFVLVAGLLGWASDRGWTKHAWGSALALACGTTLNLSLGTLWLAVYVGLPKAFAGGFAPFIGIEAAKACIAVPLLPLAWRLVGKTGNR